jgi:phage repressor protein C with HTH and peptisase S24 domain
MSTQKNGAAKASRRSAVTQPKERANAILECHVGAKDSRQEHSHLLQELADVIVEGGSMEPYLKDGDQLQCNDDVPADGKLVAAKLKDGRLFVARIERHPRKITLRFENPVRPALTFKTGEFAFIAKVSTILRDETRKGGAR